MAEGGPPWVEVEDPRRGESLRRPYGLVCDCDSFCSRRCRREDRSGCCFMLPQVCLLRLWSLGRTLKIRFYWSNIIKSFAQCAIRSRCLRIAGLSMQWSSWVSGLLAWSLFTVFPSMRNFLGRHRMLPPELQSRRQGAGARVG